MRVHRFYIGDNLKLEHDFWLNDQALLKQWNKVLRFRDGQEVVLFDGIKSERLYRIESINMDQAHLHLITEIDRKLPKQHIYLLWSLLKRDNNDLVLQKATEIGITNFVPLITDRTIRTNFNIKRARKIVIEASEQSGRSDIPFVREPIKLDTAFKELTEKVEFIVAQQGSPDEFEIDSNKKYAALVGPEGGWSDQELEKFKNLNLQTLNLGDFVLRGETAAIAVSSRLLQ